MKNNLQKKVDDILRFRWKTSPLEATWAGVHDYDTELERLDFDSRAEIIAQYEHFISELIELEKSPELLDNDEKLDLKILKNTLDVDVQLEKQYKRAERDATIYPDICLFSSYLLLMRDFAPLERRMESLLSRLREIPRLLDEGKANLGSGKNIPAAWTMMGMEITQSGMGVFSALIPIHAAQVPALQDEITRANDTAIAALDDYTRFLQNDIMPKSDGEYRLGEEMFNYLLKYQHMLPHTADDLAEIGNQTIDSTHSELEKAATEIDRNKSWQELVNEFKRDTPPADGLVDFYRREMERAKRFVMEKDLVTIPETESLSVVETPLFERSRIPYAAYLMPAPFEEEQDGTFWVTPIDKELPEEQQADQLSGHSKAGIVLTALHEAYPGHHLQLLHSNRVDSKVRRVFGTSVFAEGWALYCEEMMFEQGFYDLKSRLLQLKDQLWRACRVVIDVELHRGRMNFQEAVKMLVDVAELEEVNAISEVKRYTQSPTQPMSYIMGKLAVMKLRDDYKEKTGDNFNLKNFHDRLLSFGTIPIGLVSKEMLK